MNAFAVRVRAMILRGCLPVKGLAAFALLMMVAGFAQAQIITATITGRVVDKSGASVPNATVTAESAAIGVKRAVTTSAEGEYRIEFLPVGDYVIEVSAAGFKKFVQNGIVLAIDQTARVDAAMDVGSVNEIVTVTAGIPLVNTSNAEIGRTVE